MVTIQNKDKRFITLLRENKYFFLPYLLVLVIGVIGLGFSAQGDMILFFNRFKGSSWDLVFKYGTRLAETGGFVFWILALLFYSFRGSLMALSGTLFLLLTVGILKKVFGHLRPFLYFKDLNRQDELIGVDGVDFLLGDTSFPSGHTTGAFFLFGLSALLLPYKKLTGPFFFIGAFVVGLSRMYLSQHFLKDVVVGSVLGLFIAFLFFYLFQRIQHPSLDNNLQKLIKK